MAHSESDINIAYQKLKSFVYYDKTDLHLRARLARFECEKNFSERIKTVASVLNSSNPTSTPAFQDWLRQIDFRLTPKSINWDKTRTENSGRFISNVNASKNIEIERINYFFDGPVELHLIAVIWILHEGRALDGQLGNSCYGSRLDELDGDGASRLKLFRKYFTQYSRWRDSGIQEAKRLLTEKKTNVAILGLDVREFFYRIQVDFREIARHVNRTEGGGEWVDEGVARPSELLQCVAAICTAYRKKIAGFLSSSHGEEIGVDAGLPIGFCASLVIANWYLKRLDDQINESLRPAYYGRYVDDILLVVPSTIDSGKNGDPLKSFMNKMFVENGILRAVSDNDYEIRICPGLFLQREKCILQYFDHQYSIAGLEKFRKQLEENGSDALLLPVDQDDDSIENVAFDLIYEGSINKFRSVKGTSENRYELAKYLARQSILHVLTDDGMAPSEQQGLLKFFKGRAAIEFYDLWERVLTLFGVANYREGWGGFKKLVDREVKRIRFSKSPELTQKLQNSLVRHLSLSESMARALCDPILGLLELDAFDDSELLRKSNLIRHHFVGSPLLNYTNYTGPLISKDVRDSFEIDFSLVERSPRYLNYDECLLLVYKLDESEGMSSHFSRASVIFESANRHPLDDFKDLGEQNG